MSCKICGRPESDGYVNVAAGERCVDACHSFTTYIAKVYFRDSRQPEEREYRARTYGELVVLTKQDSEVIAFSLVDWVDEMEGR